MPNVLAIDKRWLSVAMKRTLFHKLTLEAERRQITRTDFVVGILEEAVKNVKLPQSSLDVIAQEEKTAMEMRGHFKA